MRKSVALLLLVIGIATTSSCAANQASVSDTLPEENLDQCQSLCSSVGLRLTSVVIVANQTGCVCEVAEPGPTSAAVGGAVTVMLQQRRSQAQQQAARQPR